MYRIKSYPVITVNITKTFASALNLNAVSIKELGSNQLQVHPKNHPDPDRAGLMVSIASPCHTRWACTSYIQVELFHPYEWPHKWATAVITPISRAIINPTYDWQRGPPCIANKWCLYQGLFVNPLRSAILSDFMRI